MPPTSRSTTRSTRRSSPRCSRRVEQRLSSADADRRPRRRRRRRLGGGGLNGGRHPLVHPAAARAPSCRRPGRPARPSGPRTRTSARRSTPRSRPSAISSRTSAVPSSEPRNARSARRRDRPRRPGRRAARAVGDVAALGEVRPQQPLLHGALQIVLGRPSQMSRWASNVLARCASSKSNVEALGAGRGGHVVDDPRPPARARRTCGHRRRATGVGVGRRVGSSWNGRHTTCDVVAPVERAPARFFEAALADVAPRAHDIGVDLDPQHRARPDSAGVTGGRWRTAWPGTWPGSRPARRRGRCRPRCRRRRTAGPWPVDLGAPDADRPRAVAVAVDPPDRPAVAAALEALELGDERRARRRGGSRRPPGVGCSAAHELEHRSARAGTAGPRRRAEVLHVGDRDDRRLGLPVEVASTTAAACRAPSRSRCGARSGPSSTRSAAPASRASTRRIAGARRRAGQRVRAHDVAVAATSSSGLAPTKPSTE